MLRDHLKSIPDALESLISEKKLLQASVVLLRGLKMIGKSDMQEVGALSDLRAYMTGQETVCTKAHSCSLSLIDCIDIKGHSRRRASIAYLAQDFLV